MLLLQLRQLQTNPGPGRRLLLLLLLRRRRRRRLHVTSNALHRNHQGVSGAAPKSKKGKRGMSMLRAGNRMRMRTMKTMSISMSMSRRSSLCSSSSGSSNPSASVAAPPLLTGRAAAAAANGSSRREELLPPPPVVDPSTWRAESLEESEDALLSGFLPQVQNVADIRLLDVPIGKPQQIAGESSSLVDCAQWLKDAHRRARQSWKSLRSQEPPPPAAAAALTTASASIVTPQEDRNEETKHTRQCKWSKSKWYSRSSSDNNSKIPASPADLIVRTLDIQPHQDTGLPPLVMTHGYASGLALFAPNFLGLVSSNRRIIGIDWLGFGCSSRPPFVKRSIWPSESETMSRAVEAENFFVDSLESWRLRMDFDGPFDLLGHSLGGYLSAAYALQYPEHVRRLVLASPVGIPEAGNLEASEMVTSDLKTEGKDGQAASSSSSAPLHLRTISQLWDWDITLQQIVRALGPYGKDLTQNAIAGRFRNTMIPEDTRAHIADYLYQLALAPASGELALGALLRLELGDGSPGSMRGIVARRPLEHRIEQLTTHTKTTFLFGDTDWMWKPHTQNALRKIHPSASVDLIPQSGHHLYLDNPSHFEKRVLDALNQ